MFDETKIYPASDKALEALAPYSTMAHWRCEGRGPAFVRLGKRIGYTGKALNEWLEAQTVQPAA